MDGNAEYIDLLERSLAGETETVRLYLACMAVAPPEHIPRLLEIQADETDHQAIIADLLLESVAGQSADQEELAGAPVGAQRSGSGGERTSKGAVRDLAASWGEAEQTLRGRVPGVE